MAARGSHKTVLLITSALSCVAFLPCIAAAQTPDALAGYWLSSGTYGNATLTRFFEITASDGKLIIHSTALKFEPPNGPPQISDPNPDETFELTPEGLELTGIHRTGRYRSGGCIFDASSEPVTGRIRDNAQISLDISIGQIIRDPGAMTCRMDYSNPRSTTVLLTRRIDN